MKFNPLALVGILLVSAFLRLFRIADYMTFLGDEGRDVLVVYDILHGDPTLLGPTASVGGFFLGPIYYYFMAPFLWLFNYNPVGPAIMVALFGIATVFLVYKLTSEFFGQKAGFIAAFFYAISPLVVSYSRSSWNPNPMPFFSLLTVYVLYKGILASKFWYFLICGFLFGISLQLHYLATFLGAIVAIYVLVARLFMGYDIATKLMSIAKDYALILAGFVVGWSPFLAFEVRHDFTNINSIVNFILHSGDTGGSSHFLGTVGDVFFRLFGRLVTSFPPPDQVALGAHPNLAFWYWATLIFAVSCVGLLLYQYKKSFKEKKDFVKISLLVIWLFVGVGLFGFYKKPIYDYYFGFMFPLPFILAGNFMTKIPKVAAVLIFIILFALNINGIPFKSTPNRQLAQVEEISNFVLSKTANKPFNFALITGGNSDHGYRYFFRIAGHDPVVIQTVESDPKRKSVTDQLLVVCEDPRCQPLGNSLWEIAGFGRAEITDEWQVSVVKVYRLVHYREK